MQRLKHTESSYHHYFLDLLLLFNFSAIQENLYMICLFSNLFFEGGNTINQYYKKQTCFLSLIPLNIFDNFVKAFQNVFYNFICFGTHHNFWLLVCIVQVSSESLEEIKLICTVNWIFHPLLVLWSFIILLKYGLIISRYFLGDKFLSLSPLLSYSM